MSNKKTQNNLILSQQLDDFDKLDKISGALSAI